MKVILLYHLTPRQRQVVLALCRQEHIVAKEVDERDFLQPIGALAGIEGIGRNDLAFEGVAFADPMMVFHQFPDDALFGFLKAIRECGMEPVALKAAVTPTNAYWNSLQLHAALAEEHQQMTQMGWGKGHER